MNNTSTSVKPLNRLHIYRDEGPSLLTRLGLLSVPLLNEKRIIKFDNIIYLKSDSNYTVIILEDQKLVISKTLKWFTKYVNHQFYRVHQSFLINLKSITSYDLKEHKVVLENGAVLPVARSQRKAFLKLLN